MEGMIIMGMTMTEKIIAAHAGLEEVKPGQLVTAKVDKIMAHDITGPPAFNELRKHNLESSVEPGRKRYLFQVCPACLMASSWGLSQFSRLLALLLFEAKLLEP